MLRQAAEKEANPRLRSCRAKEVKSQEGRQEEQAQEERADPSKQRCRGTPWQRRYLLGAAFVGAMVRNIRPNTFVIKS